MKTISAKTSSHTYPIVVGSDLSRQLERLVGRQVGNARLFTFIDANFYVLHGNGVRKSLGIPAGRILEIVVPSGERAKSRKILAGLQDFMLSEKITRDDFVLACGGGVTSDLVGFASSTVMRGIRWGVVSTTLLGMVDAAIGGKTGINHEAGKNLIGAFWHPAFVHSDVLFLTTLPGRQIIAGLGEVLKTAGLSGGQLMRDLQTYLDQGQIYDPKALVRLVHGCAAYKANIVARDERDSGARMVLNFGHTFGHAIERGLGYGRLLHGEAVILGLDAALALGEKIGYHSSGLAQYRSIVARLMQNVPRRKVNLQAVLDAMTLDKKRSATDQRYVMLKRTGQPVISDGIPRRAASAALKDMLARYQTYGGRRG